jgi:hypothetical protein
MTERDSGRYDAFTDSWIDQNVRVDFAWGNIPMQPNDDRGMAQLDPALDSHIIATSGYEGFPAFITGGIYDDTIPNVTMPNLIGLSISAADAALADAGFESYSHTTTTSGANSGNNATVKTQSIPAGTLVNANTAASYVSYNYTEVTSGPIFAVTNPVDAGLTAETDAWMYLLGQTVKPTVGWFINIDGVAANIVGQNNQYNNNNWEVLSVENDNAYNTGGTKVKIRSTTGNLTTSNLLGTDGTWIKL